MGTKEHRFRFEMAALGSSTAPSPGSALSTSPSSSGMQAAGEGAVREWLVIRPHVEFLHEVAARHYPSLFFDKRGTAGTAGTAEGISGTSRPSSSSLTASSPSAGVSASPSASPSSTSSESSHFASTAAASSPSASLSAGAGEDRVDAGTATMDQNDTPDGRTLALSKLVERLIAFCNREDRKTKKEIFRVIRCHNCSQASTGGTKVGVRLALPPHQVLWMRKVHVACKHASVDKTMRILLEWYIAVMRGAPDMEFVILGENTEATRRGSEQDDGGFAMCLSVGHENGLHLRGRKPPGEAERALRSQFENPTITDNLFSTPTTTSDEPVFKPGPELKVILHNLGKGC